MRFRSVTGPRPSAVGWRLAFAFALLWPPGSVVGEPELVDRIVAIIDRDIVMLSEAERAMRLVELRTGGETSLAEVVERMIETRLIEREVARFTDAPIPDEQVLDQLDVVRGSFDTPEDFQSTLALSGLGEDELRAELRRQLTINRYLERRFRALSYVTDEDVAEYYENEVLPHLESPRDAALEEIDAIRRILEERRFNERVARWIDELKERAHIRRYVW